jgi:cyclophilin family peptidyl-prolyl cis-trans isomerase
MPSRSRERELAKQAARRQAERHAAARRRRITAGIVGGVVGIAAIAVGYSLVFGGDDTGAAASPTPSVSPSAPSSPGGEPQQTGTVTPEVTPPDVVACGAERPAAADEPKPQFDRAPSPDDVLKDGVTYTAVVRTSCGTFEFELRSKQAPIAVANFIFLAEQGFYDGLTFHRIVPDFVIQAGDPLGSGAGGPGYAFADEFSPKLRFDHPGVVAMANSGANTNGSQWFVTLDPDSASHLNDVHTIFGDVTEGMDVVDEIGAIAPNADGTSSEAVYIDSVKITKEPPPHSTPAPTG